VKAHTSALAVGLNLHVIVAVHLGGSVNISKCRLVNPLFPIPDVVAGEFAFAGDS